MIVGQKSGRGVHAMGMCVLEIKDCDALESVGWARVAFCRNPKALILSLSS